MSEAAPLPTKRLSGRPFERVLENRRAPRPSHSTNHRYLRGSDPDLDSIFRLDFFEVHALPIRELLAN